MVCVGAAFAHVPPTPLGGGPVSKGGTNTGHTRCTMVVGLGAMVGWLLRRGCGHVVCWWERAGVMYIYMVKENQESTSYCYI